MPPVRRARYPDADACATLPAGLESPRELDLCPRPGVSAEGQQGGVPYGGGMAGRRTVGWTSRPSARAVTPKATAGSPAPICAKRSHFRKFHYFRHAAVSQAE